MSTAVDEHFGTSLYCFPARDFPLPWSLVKGPFGALSSCWSLSLPRRCCPHYPASFSLADDPLACIPGVMSRSAWTRARDSLDAAPMIGPHPCPPAGWYKPNPVSLSLPYAFWAEGPLPAVASQPRPAVPLFPAVMTARGVEVIESESSADANVYERMSFNLAAFRADYSVGFPAYTQKGDAAQADDVDAIVAKVQQSVERAVTKKPARRRLDLEAEEAPADEDEEDVPQRSKHLGSSRRGPVKRERAPEPDPEDDEAREVPDVLAYLADFGTAEPEQVKLLRAAANYLSNKDSRNRIRWTNTNAQGYSQQPPAFRKGGYPRDY